MAKIIPAILVIVISLLISACGSGQLFGPTLIPTSTLTLTPTITPTITLTPTPTHTPTLTPTPTPACQVANGDWESKETASGLPFPLFSFTVQNCEITAWEMYTSLGGGLFQNWFGKEIAPISNNQFSQDKVTDDGTISLTGIFDSATSSIGTIKFPKGFILSIGVLNKDVSLSWTAFPIK